MAAISIAAIDAVIREVAAAEIMPRFRKLVAGDIEMKGVNDPVTVADKETERALIARLIDMLPGSVVVGEESFAADPGILSRFGGDHYVWVIDPIDGTSNFINGKTEFGVMVALVRRKQTIAAWIHDPNSGDTIAAEQGAGVWLRGGRMKLAGHDSAIPRLAIVGSRVKKAFSNSDFSSFLKQLPELVVGSAAAFDYARLFTGECAFADSILPRVTHLLYRYTKPWDHVPGLFFHAESGGYAATFSTHAYDMEDFDKGLLLSPDKASWEGFHAAVKPMLESFGAV